jgi:hypothetical protein
MCSPEIVWSIVRERPSRGDGKAGQDTQELDDHDDDPQSQLRFVMYKSAGKPQRLLADQQTNALWNTPASGCPPSTPTARTVRMIWIATSDAAKGSPLGRTLAAASQTSPARQHQDHKGEPDRQSVGIEIVGEPGRVVPALSDGEEEQGGRRRLVAPIMGQLCDRPGIDAIEEEFDRGDGRRFLAAPTQQSFPAVRPHHLEPAMIANVSNDHGAGRNLRKQ